MSLQLMNREARRALASRAKDAALQLSRSAIDYDEAGRVVRVEDPRAQAALVRAYERMLRSGGAPQVLRISDETASAFPCSGRRPHVTTSAWLAICLDDAGLATYALRWLVCTRIDPAAQRALAEAVLLFALAVECARPGFPVAGHA